MGMFPIRRHTCLSFFFSQGYIGDGCISPFHALDTGWLATDHGYGMGGSLWMYDGAGLKKNGITERGFKLRETLPFYLNAVLRVKRSGELNQMSMSTD